MTGPGAVDETAAPADRRAHAPWGMGRTIVAYVVLFVLALGSIWFINRRVDQLANDAHVAGAR